MKWDKRDTDEWKLIILLKLFSLYYEESSAESNEKVNTKILHQYIGKMYCVEIVILISKALTLIILSRSSVVELRQNRLYVHNLLLIILTIYVYKTLYSKFFLNLYSLNEIFFSHNVELHGVIMKRIRKVTHRKETYEGWRW